MVIDFRPLEQRDFRAMVQDILASKRINRVQLAAMCEISESHVRNMEKRDITPSWPIGQRIIDLWEEYCGSP